MLLTDSQIALHVARMCVVKNGGFDLINYTYLSRVYHEQKQKFSTAGFKAETIKAIEENKSNISEPARQLSISIQNFLKIL